MVLFPPLGLPHQPLRSITLTTNRQIDCPLGGVWIAPLGVQLLLSGPRVSNTCEGAGNRETVTNAPTLTLIVNLSLIMQRGSDWAGTTYTGNTRLHCIAHTVFLGACVFFFWSGPCCLRGAYVPCMCVYIFWWGPLADP